MTTHEMTATACGRLQHIWESRGPAGDPTELIHRIAVEVTSNTTTRHYLEAVMYDRWAQLHAEIGAND